MKHDAETDRDLWEAQANHLYEANCRMKRQIEELEEENNKLQVMNVGISIEVGKVLAENKRLREALEEIATPDLPKGVYGEGIYWWCVEIAMKALGEVSDG